MLLLLTASVLRWINQLEALTRMRRRRERFASRRCDLIRRSDDPILPRPRRFFAGFERLGHIDLAIQEADDQAVNSHLTVPRLWQNIVSDNRLHGPPRAATAPPDGSVIRGSTYLHRLQFLSRCQFKDNHKSRRFGRPVAFFAVSGHNIL